MLHVVDQYLIYHLLLRNVEHIGMEKEMDETRLSGTPPTPDFLLKRGWRRAVCSYTALEGDQDQQPSLQHI